MHDSPRTRASATLLGATLSLVLGGAHAAEQLRVPGTLPVGACQAALPAYEGAIRKRPLAVQNESAETAFVTCAWPAEPTARPDEAFLRLFNITNASAVVQCTLIQGPTGAGARITRSSPVSANSMSGEMFWNASNSGGSLNTALAVSCALPPGTGIGYLGYRMFENVGN